MLEEVRIPEISENVTTGKVVSVLVKVGDRVEADDILLEFETEKALVEIPSPAAGKIVELPVKEGQELRIGDLIAKIDTDAAAGAAAPKADSSETQKAPPPPAETDEAPSPEEKPKPTTNEVTPSQAPTAKSGGTAETAATAEKRPPAPASPSIRRFARELGVDIHRVKGSGTGGRISEEDVKAFVKQGLATAGHSGAPGKMAEPELPDFSRWGEIETTELPAVRRLTARSVATSWRTVPHVTQFDRCDITLVEDFLKKNGPKLEKEGIKLTLTAVVAKVCAAALVKFPRFNASIDMAENRLIFKKYVHIGIAAATERGLLVPVIRNAHRKGIRRLAADIADLAGRARNKKIKPDEMEGGTFTISNQGGIGGTQFTPIVMWPQVAILGISRTATEPVFVDNQFRPRPVLPLALSYDHRIIDGADAAGFLRWICESLEQPFTLHLDE